MASQPRTYSPFLYNSSLAAHMFTVYAKNFSFFTGHCDRQGPNFNLSQHILPFETFSTHRDNFLMMQLIYTMHC